MRPPRPGREDGAALLMIVIVTMVLLTMGITMLLLNSSDTATINPGGEQPISEVLPPSPSGNLIPSENDGTDDDFPGAENWNFAYYNYDDPLAFVPPANGGVDLGVEFLNQNLPPAGQSSDGILILPPAISAKGPVPISNDITYYAQHGIYFGIDMTSSGGNSQITLKADDGIIKIGGTGSVILHKVIELLNTSGNIIVEPGGVLNSTQGGSQGNILIKAGGNVDLSGALLTSGNNITIEAGGDVIMNGAILTAGGSISITAGKLIDLRNANLTSGGSVTVTGDSATMNDASMTVGGSVSVTGENATLNNANLTVGGNVSINGDEVNLSDVNLNVGGNIAITGDNITLNGATLSAGGSITITASGNITVNAATLTAGGSISITAGTLIDLRNSNLTASGKRNYITLTLTGGTSTNKAQILVDNARFNKTATVTNTGLNTITITGTPALNNTSPPSPYP